MTLARAMVVFVLAGMRSLPRALLFGVCIGIAEALLRFNYLTQPGLADFVGFVIVLVVVFVQSRTSSDDGRVRLRPQGAPTAGGAPPDLVGPPALADGRPAVALVVVVLLPLLVTRPSRQLVFASIACFAICALSLTVITGWAGQLSLAQMTFAGLGALIAAAFVRDGRRCRSCWRFSLAARRGDRDRRGDRARGAARARAAPGDHHVRVRDRRPAVHLPATVAQRRQPQLGVVPPRLAVRARPRRPAHVLLPVRGGAGGDLPGRRPAASQRRRPHRRSPFATTPTRPRPARSSPRAPSSSAFAMRWRHRGDRRRAARRAACRACRSASATSSSTTRCRSSAWW